MKNIVFDIGNVLLSYQPRVYLSNYYNETVVEELMKIIFSSSEWIQLDKGTIQLDEAINSLIVKHPTYKDEIEFVLHNWTTMLAPIEDTIKIVHELHTLGHPLYLLSNIHVTAIEAAIKKYDFFKLFNGSIISAYEHMLKPEPEIYKLLLERYSLEASNTIFIDDSLENVLAAKKLHIIGIQLTPTTNLKEELKQLLP